VLMLEPLFRCNLSCSGCGKIDYPDAILNKRLSVAECLDAVDANAARRWSQSRAACSTPPTKTCWSKSSAKFLKSFYKCNCVAGVCARLGQR
jgi:hypothetical protein